jgi:Fe-S cluster biogenesis protein NfuA
MEMSSGPKTDRLAEGERQRLRRLAQASLDRVRPALQADGGDAEILDVTEDGRLVVKLVGACGGCPMSPQTLKQGLEKVLHRDVPELRGVEAR